jgi:hypothetical protein
MITQRYASQANGMLASRGRVPRSEESHLLVTNIARGSSGFVLQSANATHDIDQSLKLALDHVAGLNPLNKVYRAKVKIKEVRAKGRSPKLSYRLQALHEL